MAAPPVLDHGMVPRRVLDLGRSGKIPVDTLFELYLETRDGHMLTLCQSKMAKSLGSWVSDIIASKCLYMFCLSGMARWCF